MASRRQDWPLLDLLPFWPLFLLQFLAAALVQRKSPLFGIPTFSSTGPVMAVTLGAVLAGTGFNLSPSASFHQTIMVPVVVLNRMVASATPMPNSNGSATSPYDGIFVMQSGNLSQVVIVDKSSTPGFGTVNLYTITNGIQVSAANGPSSWIYQYFHRCDRCAGQLAESRL